MLLLKKNLKIILLALLLQSTCQTILHAGKNAYSMEIETKSEEQNNVESCRICITDFKPKDIIDNLQCSHTFHKACINEWYASSGKLSCPLCRSDNADIIEEFTKALDSQNIHQLGRILTAHKTLANYVFDTETKTTALHRAAQKGLHHSSRWLIYFSANPNARNIWGEIPLHLAASTGHWQTVQILCDLNSFIEAQDHQGNSPLHRASAGGWTKTVNILLHYLHKQFIEQDHDAVGYRKNLNLQTYFKKQTPLHCAVDSGNPNTAKALLRRHADKHTCDWKNKTPLQSAVLQGHTSIVNVLIPYRIAGVE